MKMTMIDRLVLLCTCLLAGYQIAVGVNGLDTLPIIAFTCAFGVLMVAGLLILILGYEVLDSPIVVVISSIIPLSLSLGLVWDHLVDWQTPYLVFVMLGFLAIVITRINQPGKLAIIVLAVVHGIAGMIILILPLYLSRSGQVRLGFAWVSLGGALIGSGGLLLSFLKTGHPIFSRELILRILPGLLLVMSAAYVVGFALK